MIFQSIRSYLVQIGTNEKGVTTVEYAIMLSLIAIAVAVSSPGISDAVTSIFDETATALASA